MGATRSGHRAYGRGPEKIRAQPIPANPRREESLCHGRLRLYIQSVPEPNTYDHGFVRTILRLLDDGIEAVAFARLKRGWRSGEVTLSSPQVSVTFVYSIVYMHPGSSAKAG